MHTRKELLHKIADTMKTTDDARVLINMAYLLLECGYNPNNVNDDDETAMHIACAVGNIEMIELLVHFGANVEAKVRILTFCVKFLKNLYGMTPFFYAVGNGMATTCRYLYSQVKVDIHAKTKDLKTSLIALFSFHEFKIQFYNKQFIENKHKVSAIVKLLVKEVCNNLFF